MPNRLPVMVHDLPPGSLPEASWSAAGDDREEQLLQVGDLARACGKTVRAIHHYEDVGLLRPSRRSKGRFRLYGANAVARVRWIGKLHDLGMTLSEIQQILELWEQAPTAPEAMAKIRAVYHQKLAAVREQIDRLSSLERELYNSLEYLDTCDGCATSELVAACSSCSARDEGEPQPALVAGLHAGRTS
jgi:DNA-binding transcriptional MerR regulator